MGEGEQCEVKGGLVGGPVLTPHPQYSIIMPGATLQLL